MKTLYKSNHAKKYVFLLFTLVLSVFYAVGSYAVNITSPACYQEHPVITNQVGTDGDCSLLYTGNISLSVSSPTIFDNATDGNWNTKVNVNPTGQDFFVNYTKPWGALNNSLFQIRTENVYQNYTIPTECWFNNSNWIRFHIYCNAGVGILRCYGGSSGETAITGVDIGCERFEESMIWNISSNYGIDACTNSFGISSNATGMIFTGLYEGNNTGVNISASGTITYAPYGTSTTTSIYPSYTNVRNFSYCIYPSWAEFDVDYTINYNEYGTTTTRQRSAENVLVTDSLTTVPLYVLNSPTAVNIAVNVIDGYNNNIVNAYVTATRNIAGTDYIVQTAVTDGFGMAYFTLDSTATYTLSASKTGYTSSSTTTVPTSLLSPYKITLGSSTTQNATCFSQSSFAFAPPLYELVNGTNYQFGFNVTSSSSTCVISSCSLTVSVGGGLIAGTTNDSTCYATTVQSSGQGTNVTLTGIYTFDDGTSFTQYAYYSINNYQQGQFSLLTFFQDIQNFTGAGFDWKARMMLSFIIIFGLMAVISLKFNALINPEPALITQLALVLLFSIAGFLTIPTGLGGVINFPVVNGFNMGQYAIFLLDMIGTGAFFMWRFS